MKNLKANRLSHLAHGEVFPTAKQAAARAELERQQAQPARTVATAHTPGPWHIGAQVKKPHSYALVGIGNGAVHVGYASVTPCMHPFEADANARLIAAAPALLKALERTVARLQHHLCNVESCDMEASDDLTLEQAQAAIALASGGDK